MTVTASTRVIERPSATSVPREYVHKAAASEVLLTGLSPAGPDRFHVTARWPSRHPFYGPKGGFHDPLLVAESVRQSVPLLSHVAYAVPFGHRQSWNSLRYEVDPVALTFTGNDADIDMHVTCSETVRRTGRLASLRMQVDLYIDGRPLGVAETRFCNLSPAVYPRLRGPHADAAQAAQHAVPLAPATAPARVARTRTRDVVLSPAVPTDPSPCPTPTRAQLRTDFSHPVLFDHPADHVPGMLLLEAARQSAHAAAHPLPGLATGLDAVFNHYVEFDAPCWIDRTPAGNPADTHRLIHVQALQNDTPAFTATVALTSP
ncbi:adhesin [Streptomyces humidus]|uniref:Adhesin n=1 Tax=Streptomyces humidus TaxID=52259 RepID=A0A918LBF7_9ACTN|nr:ScbA/BarX family gamma-butyrolactone biosynthesis protein [Streptomyces humidus]GGS27886.1 adhesin [Streptomyces humidus]